MTLPKQKFREMVLQILYGLETYEDNEEAILGLIKRELKVSKSHCTRAALRAKDVRAKSRNLDSLIEEAATDYSIDRIHTVERNVLRLATYEMLYDDEIPPKVAMSEAVRLAKKFSTPEAASFVNAILDTIYRKQGEEEQAKDEHK
ncbi:transcription antitermination factor NusB [Simkania negevensis]|uniref:Transcription antitermination protein NusB n=1 Tax=Simkania negevensis TaxID=83561 RepID=A0ABS3ATV7_9BACT|nr:transcription antitermination factor NusB [Simkania negevensis]